MTRFPNRREAISRLGGGFGALALSALEVQANPEPGGVGGSTPHQPPRAGDLLPKPHHTPKATAVIQLFMHGGSSHVDLLDPKPQLEKFDGKPPPAEVADDEKLTGNMLRSPFKC